MRFLEPEQKDLFGNNIPTNEDGKRQFKIKCSKCKYGHRTKKYQHCNAKGIVFGLGVAFQECNEYQHKSDKRLEVSHETQIITQSKQKSMEEGRKNV